jgi:hypothetical protein
VRRAGPGLDLPHVLEEELEQSHLPELGTDSRVILLLQGTVLDSKWAGHHHLPQGFLELLGLLLGEAARVVGAEVAAYLKAALQADHPHPQLFAAYKLPAMLIYSPALRAFQLVYFYLFAAFQETLAL